MSNEMARPFNPETSAFIPTLPSSPISHISGASDDSISTFSETVVSSQSSFDDDYFINRPTPRLKFPPSTSMEDRSVEIKKEQANTRTASTWEEDAALFSTTEAARVKLPLFTAVFNTANTALRARQAISASSERDFLEAVARIEPDERFTCIPRVQLPPSVPNLADEEVIPTPTGVEESTHRPAPVAISTCDKKTVVSSRYPASRLNPETFEFVSEKKSGSKKSSCSRYPNSKFNPKVIEYVPTKKYLNLTLSGAASDFVPLKYYAMNAEAPIFLPGGWENTAVYSRSSEFGEGQEVVPAVTSLEPRVVEDGIEESQSPPGAAVSSTQDESVSSDSSDTTAEDHSTEPTVPDVRSDTPRPPLEPTASLPTTSVRDTSVPPVTTPDWIEHIRQERLTGVLWDFEYNSSGVHHFNFFGFPVRYKSATPPATSLAIICGKPKIRMGYNINSGSLLRPILLYNASLLVDPVVYRGDPVILGQLRGSALENAAIGVVYKAYSEYGWWEDDGWDRDDDYPDCDPLDKARYGPDATYLNATSRLQYAELAQNADDSANEAMRKKIRRQNFAPVKSHLSKVTPVEDDSPVEPQEDALSKAGKDLEPGMSTQSASITVEDPLQDLSSDGETSDHDQPSSTGIADRASVFGDEASSSGSDTGSTSETETTGPIHPELVVSPLKISKSCEQSSGTVDQSCMISPLKLRKPSAESTSNITSCHVSEESERSVSEDTTPNTSSSEPSSTSPSSLCSESAEEKQNEEFWPAKPAELDAIHQLSTPKAISTYYKKNSSVVPQSRASDTPAAGLLAPIPIDLAFRRKPKSSCYVAKEPFISCNDLPEGLHITPIQVFQARTGSPPPGYGRFVRSPECRDLNSLLKREGEVPYQPKHLSPIKEEDLIDAFFRSDKMEVEEIGNLGANVSERDTTSNSSSDSVRPLRPGLKRRTTVPNLRGIKAQQENDFSNLTISETPCTPQYRAESPIKRLQAPAPNRMRGGWDSSDVEFGSEDEDIYEQTSGESSGPPASPTNGRALVLSQPQYSNVFREASPLRSPKGKQRVFEPYADRPVIDIPILTASMREQKLGSTIALSSSPHGAEDDHIHLHLIPRLHLPPPTPNNKLNEHFSSGRWFAQKWNGNDSQAGSPEPDTDAEEASHPTTPEVAAVEIRPTTPPVTISSPEISIAVPHLPLTVVESHSPLRSSITLVVVQTTKPIRVPPTSVLGLSATFYFDQSRAATPSPTRSIAAHAFPAFEGIQRAAADFGEYSDPTRTSSPTQPQRESADTPAPAPLLTFHTTSNPVTEGVLPSTAAPSISFAEVSPLPCFTIRTARSPPSTASSADTYTDNSWSSNQSVIHNTANPFPQPGSVCDVLSRRTVRPDGSLRPSLRASSWAKVENKLQKKKRMTSGSTNVNGGPGRKEGNKGWLGKLCDKVFGRVKK